MGCGSSRQTAAPSAAANKESVGEAHEERGEETMEVQRTRAAAAFKARERHDEEEAALNEASLSADSTLKVVAVSLRDCFSEADMWRPSHLTVGLFYLRRARIRERRTMLEEGRHPHQGHDHVPASDKIALEDMHGLLFWCSLIEGTYAGSTDELCATTALSERDVVDADWKSKALRPGYYVAVIPDRETVVLAIRGTSNISDAISDAVAAQDEYNGHQVHRGMWRAAHWFLEHVGPTIATLMEDDGRLTHIKVVGHSLGGATAALTAILMRDKGLPATATVIAPACCASLDLARSSAAFIDTVVHQDDIVSRVSTRAMNNLRRDLAEYPWGKELMDDAKRSKMVRLAAESKGLQMVASTGARAMRSARKGVAKGARKGAALVRRRSSRRKRGSGAGSAADTDSDVPPPEPIDPDSVANLYPPGRVFHLHTHCSDAYQLSCVDNTFFADIELSPTMIKDHSSTAYLAGLRQVLLLWDAPVENNTVTSNSVSSSSYVSSSSH